MGALIGARFRTCEATPGRLYSPEMEKYREETYQRRARNAQGASKGGSTTQQKQRAARMLQAGSSPAQATEKESN